MPNLTFPKSALEPRPNLPAGPIQVMFKGFKPKLSAQQPGKTQSTNLNPELVIVNDTRSTPDGKPLNGQKLFDSLNLSFLPRLQDFCHCFGSAMVEDGDSVDLPGYFSGDTSAITTSNGETIPDPSKWGQYAGPLLNEIGDILLKEVPSRKKGAKPTDTQVDIDRYICRVAGCTTQHMETLIR